MKLAITQWNERIAPVFDVAREMLIIETESGKIISKEVLISSKEFPANKIMELADLRVDVVICGAISNQASYLIASHDIKCFSFIAGNLEDIIQSWLSGNFTFDCFAMPGCRRRGGQRRNRKLRNRFGQRWAN